MSSSVSIIVKSLMSGGPGATTSIAVQPEDTIWQVKLKIAAKKDIAAVTQRLLFHGNVLRDELTVAYYELKHGSLVHLVVTAPKAGAAGPASASSPAGSATAAGAGAGAGVPAASAAAPAAAEKVEFKSSSSSESAGTAAGASSSDGSLTVRVHSEDGRTGSMQVQVSCCPAHTISPPLRPDLVLALPAFSRRPSWRMCALRWRALLACRCACDGSCRLVRGWLASSFLQHAWLT